MCVSNAASIRIFTQHVEAESKVVGQFTTTLAIWVPCMAPQTCLVDEFVILLVAKGEADPLPGAPPFSPGFFARGQMSLLRNIFISNDLR